MAEGYDATTEESIMRHEPWSSTIYFDRLYGAADRRQLYFISRKLKVFNQLHHTTNHRGSNSGLPIITLFF
jgi:hypothetical protein